MEKYKLSGKMHHYLGIELNIQTWNLLEKKDRTKQDDNTMIAFAFGSQYHWYHSPEWKPENAQRGEWLISRVYSVLKNADKALEHANKCFELTKQNEIGDFDLAYSYEALYRSYKIAENKEKESYYYALAKDAGLKIKDEEDKKIFFADLDS